MKGLNIPPSMIMTMLDWAERERLIIEMLKKEISPKEVARQTKTSLRDVYKIRNKHFGRYKENELTVEHQEIILFTAGKKPAEVAVELKITLDQSTRDYIKYLESYYLGKFGQDYKYIQGYLPQIKEICEVIKSQD